MSAIELRPIQAIVLALAIERRLYGYEVAGLVLERSVSGVLVKPTKTAAYSAIARLEQLGYVRGEVVDGQPEQVSKRRWDDRRRWYRATPEGLHAYKQWVTGKIEDEPERAALLVRVAIASRLGTEGLRRILRECEALCNEREQALEALQARQAAAASGIEGLCDRLVIGERRIALRGTREWISAARDEIEAYERKQTGRRAAAGGAGERGEGSWRRS